jgi:arylsulfatase A-like enzyme
MRPAPLTLPALLTAVLFSAGCWRAHPAPPLRFIEQPTLAGGLALSGRMTVGGEARPALLASASYRINPPRRALLTFGLGAAYAGREEAAGWYHLTLRADDRILFERRLNPRALRAWRNFSLPLTNLRRTTLSFEISLRNRHGEPVARQQDLLLGIAEPTLHDLTAYGEAKNVLLVSIDTLRRDHVGIHGYSKPTTPRLDSLAPSAIVCDDAVSVSSWTLPAHLSLLTSAPPAVHGGVDMRHGFNGGVPTLPRLLHDAGYATQAVTSHLYVSQVYGVGEGFDHLDMVQDRRASDVVRRGLDLIDRWGDRPFFLFLHFYDPHWHYDPPATTRRIFETEYRGTLTGLWQDFKRYDRSTIRAADLNHLLALYDGEIRYVDDELGTLFDHLRARGLDRNTLVIVTSDHGEEFLDHGSWEHQKTLYEEVIRIPLVISGPGVKPRRESQPVSLLDIAPTILAWAGLTSPPSFRGTSLLTPPVPRDQYGETEHTTDGAKKLFLRAGAGRWKAILDLSPTDSALLREEWFDLGNDPKEQRSQPPRPDVADEIRQRALLRFREDRSGTNTSRTVCLSADQRERLRALGYLGAAGRDPHCEE